MDCRNQTPELHTLPESLSEDIESIRQAAAQFAAGKITEAELKALCGPMAVCQERAGETYMLRPRLVAGVILPDQMRALAEVSARYGDGVLHFTTRQNVQVHGVPLADVAEALVALQAAGLATKGTGGNAVRNVATCPDTGVCPREAFEVAPHAIALTEFLLPDPVSFRLPRKYKIAVSGCDCDCAGASVSDLGLIATIRDGARGFTVYAAGGLGARSAVGQVLEQFVPEADIYLVAEAVKRVFNQHGNRQNRAHARIRFLVEDLGFAAFKDLYRQELAKLREEAPAEPAPRPLPQPNLPEPAGEQKAVVGGGADFEAWKARNVAPQSQPGRNLVSVLLPLGDLDASVLKALAEVVEDFGEGVLRATATQNVLLRWVRDDQLPALHVRLAELGLAQCEPLVLRNLVSCVGAGTCRPGLLFSRGLAAALSERLRAGTLDLAALGELRIKVSGCPNACGHHPVADIGFSGALRRVGERQVPHYTVHLGGVVQAGATHLAEVVGALPARGVPGFLVDLLAAFAASAQSSDFTAFVRGNEALIGDLLTRHAAVPAFEEDSSYYCDWGADEPYSPRS
jgi:sulfite reductase (ferredoxin)